MEYEKEKKKRDKTNRFIIPCSWGVIELDSIDKAWSRKKPKQRFIPKGRINKGKQQKANNRIFSVIVNHR